MADDFDVNKLKMRINLLTKKILTTKNVALVFIFLFLYALLPPSIQTLTVVISTILPNVGDLLLLTLTALLISFVLIISFNLLFSWLYGSDKNRGTFRSTVNLMIAISIVGLFLISGWFGHTTMDLKLRNSTGGWVGNLSCQSSSDSIIVGSSVNCRTEPYITNRSASIKFTFKDGMVNTSHFENLDFTAPANVEYVYVSISGSTKGTPVELSVGYPMTFLTSEGDKERSDKALMFSIALLGVVLFSVPPFVLNMKKICETK